LVTNKRKQHVMSTGASVEVGAVDHGPAKRVRLCTQFASQAVAISKESTALISPLPPSSPEDSSAEGILDKIFPLVWSFLLDRSPAKRGEARVFDFKSIGALMVVNRSSKGAFDECLGWHWCCRALQRESNIRQKLAHSTYLERVKSGGFEGFERRRQDFKDEHKWCSWALQTVQRVWSYESYTFADRRR
jgi:hypothetical protein